MIIKLLVSFVVTDFFDKIILPILLYGCEIWGYEDIECIEVFYRKYLKYILRLNIQTTRCMVYGEAGKKPLSITIKSRMVCFWHKIMVGVKNKLYHEPILSFYFQVRPKYNIKTA